MKKSILPVIMIALVLLSEAGSPEASYVFVGKYPEGLVSRTITMHIIGTTNDYEKGVLGILSVSLLNGTPGFIIFDDNTKLDPSTAESAMSAIKYSMIGSGANGSFFISYDMNAESVSGRSTGSSVAIAAMALLQNLTLKHNVAITGDINANGSLADAGGVLQKAISAGEHNLSLIVPDGQSMAYIYEGIKDNNGEKRYFMARRFNVSEYISHHYGTEIIEAKEIGYALGLMAE